MYNFFSLLYCHLFPSRPRDIILFIFCSEMVDFYSKLVIVFIKKETVEYFSIFGPNAEKFEPE